MPQHALPVGTILDNHYRIDSLLGEGGFGITYAASNIRLDSKVAIKELFWRDHSARDASASLDVALIREEDGEFFRRQKEHFLREARMLRDFSNRSEIAHVLDYFEANDTAYIVMEYVEGRTLSDYVAERGPIPPEDLFRRFLPLVECLSLVHQSGVIHRDISPDNVMVQPDGNLKLIDFGAAREYAEQKFSAIVTKRSFAPPEQHDQKGRLGPWTDVYALCATLYFCVTGQPPLDSVQRMFVDDLRAPSELRPELEAELKRGYESIILRGMALIAANRWQSMNDLAGAMRKVLPAPVPPPRPRPWLYALLAVLCIAIATGGILWWTNRDRPKFNCVTETFRFTAPTDMSVSEFAQAQEELNTILDNFAGEDNYIVTPSGRELNIELPLDLFEGRDIGEVLDEEMGDMLKGYDFSCIWQIQVDWDNPTASMFAGKNQILSEELTGETAIFSYDISDRKLTMGQRANLLMDFKTRLDALDTPYAFGTAYGNPDRIVYRIDPSRIGRCVTETIGISFPLEIAGEASLPSQTLSFDSFYTQRLAVIDNGDGTFGLRCELSNYLPEEIQKLTDLLLKSGQKTIYLQTGSISNMQPLAKIDLQAPIEDGILEFQDFMFEGLEKIDAEHRYILDYLASLINDTDLPTSCSRTGEGIWDEKYGDVLFDEVVSDRFSLLQTYKACDEQIRNVLVRIKDEKGYDCSYSNGMFWISLHLQLNPHLVEDISAIVTELLEEYPISDIIFDCPVVIQLMDENFNRYRIVLKTEWDSKTEEHYHWAYTLFSHSDSEELAPYAEEFNAWWDSFPIEDYGYEKELRL